MRSHCNAISCGVGGSVVNYELSCVTHERQKFDLRTKISGRGKRKEKTKETKGNGFNAKGTQNKTKPPPIPRAEPTNNEGGKRHKKEILGGKDPKNEEGPAKGVKQGSGYPITRPAPPRMNANDTEKDHQAKTK